MNLDWKLCQKLNKETFWGNWGTLKCGLYVQLNDILNEC